MQPNEIELVHGQIDGANDPERTNAFRELILRDPEARKLYEDLSRLSEILDDVQEIPAPADLRSGVMERVSLERRSTRTSRRPSTPWIGYAVALAAGIVLGVVGLNLSGGADGPRPEEVSGTLVTQPSPGATMAPVTSLHVGGGAIGISADGDRVDLVISGNAEDWRSVDLEFDPDVLTFDLPASKIGSVGRVETAGRGRLAIVSVQPGRIQGSFLNGKAGSTVLTFSVYREGLPASTGTFALKQH